MEKGRNYKKLESKIEEIYKINNIINMLYWDISVCTPINSIKIKQEKIAYLKKLSHKKLISKEIGKLIDLAEKESGDLNEWQFSNLQKIITKYKTAACIPQKLNNFHDKNVIECEQAWRIAIDKNDYLKIIPCLSKVVSSTREIAEKQNVYLKKDSIYQILVNRYNPNINSLFLKNILFKIKKELPLIINEIQEQQKQDKLLPIPADLSGSQQLQIIKKIAQLLDFDFTRGRIDYAHHYFCGGYPGDTRLLIKKSDNFLQNIMKAVHEIGHGLYEQNLPNKYKNQPVGKAAGIAFHESQALIMESHIARSREFMVLISKILRDQYNFTDKAYSADNLYKHITRIAPSSIRLQSDELTHLLHVVLRCKIEEAIIDGQIKLKDLPNIWDDIIKKYLGIKTDLLKNSYMQDIHWFKGYFGYFPAYCIGSLLASKIMLTMQKENKSFLQKIELGDLSQTNAWLNNNIRCFGSLKNIEQLLGNPIAELVSVDSYLSSIKAKYLHN